MTPRLGARASHNRRLARESIELSRSDKGQAARALGKAAISLARPPFAPLAERAGQSPTARRERELARASSWPRGSFRRD